MIIIMKINTLRHMDIIKIFTTNEKKKLETQIQMITIYSQDIADGIWHRKICHANNERQKITNGGSNRTTKSRKMSPKRRRCPRGVMVKTMDSKIIVSLSSQLWVK